MSLRARLVSRRDLLLENIALHHQLMVLERSNRRSRARTFDGSDRWLWVFLSRWWPRWREALTIIQPQTVVRWQRTPWWSHRDFVLRIMKTVSRLSRGKMIRKKRLATDTSNGAAMTAASQGKFTVSNGRNTK